MYQAFYNKHFGDVLVVQDFSNNEGTSSKIIFNNENITVLENNSKKGYNFKNWSAQNIDFRNLEDTTQMINKILINNKISDTLILKSTDNFVVGKIIDIFKDPKSNKLSICQVDVGHEVLQIVCGGTNLSIGAHVVVALPGTIMPNGIYIKLGKLLNYESKGMICSAKELNIDLETKDKDIYITDLAPGNKFEVKYE